MDTDDQTPTRSGRVALYTAIGAAVLAAAGLVAALVVGLGGSSHASADRRPDHRPSPSAIQPAVVPTPSATVRLLQEQLAQLNYYEGPVNGLDSPAVHQAISYLQRDAHLSRTGELTPATRAALSRMLVEGDNQMAG